MSSRGRVAVFAVLIFISLGVAVFFWQSSGTDVISSAAYRAHSMKPNFVGKVPTSSATTGSSSEIALAQKVPPESFSEIARTCFPDLPNSVTTPNQFVQEWRSTNANSVEVTDYIHYFFKNNQGHEMRAQILYNYSANRQIRQFKLYRVLEDGLPDPIEIDKNDQHNPNNTTLAKYIDFDSVFEIQKKWMMRDHSNNRIDVEESNTNVVEFQLLQNGRVFRCHEDDCECTK